jgi:hypothetical protein
MANEGIYIRLWQVGPAPRTSILLNDIEVGEGGMKWAGRGGFPRSGAVYVPTTGVVELSYTSTVAVSYESGSIGGFITRGLLAYEFRVGLAFTDAVMRNRGWENYDDTATTIIPAPALASKARIIRNLPSAGNFFAAARTLSPSPSLPKPLAISMPGNQMGENSQYRMWNTTFVNRSQKVRLIRSRSFRKALASS